MNPSTEDSFIDIHFSVTILAFLVRSVVLRESCDSHFESIRTALCLSQCNACGFILNWPSH